MQLVCDNVIAEIRGKKKIYIYIYIYIGIMKRGMAFGNAIATIPFHFFFFLNKLSVAHNFYNIFTTNFKCQVVIVGLKK